MSSERDQFLANELEEMRITTLIDVCLCCEPQYRDYLGKLLNEQFKELADRLSLPPHQSDTAERMVRSWYGIPDEPA